MTDEERARAIVAEWYETDAGPTVLVSRIATALAAARADERERAAREADAEAEANRSWESRWAAIRIAAAIRSLPNPPQSP